jgi:acetolactate synthase small subunit
MRRILSVLMENEPGALSRVVGLFSQRGYNIESLNVAPTTDNTLSRLTLTTTGDDLKIEQITKHLNKIVDVVKVVDLTEGAHVERDMLLVKVRAEGEPRTSSAVRLSMLVQRPISCSSRARSTNSIRSCQLWAKQKYSRLCGQVWPVWLVVRRCLQSKPLTACNWR